MMELVLIMYTYLLMCRADHGPVHKTGELLDLSLNPRLEDRIVPSIAIDCDRFNIGVVEVGLVEHVR